MKLGLLKNIDWGYVGALLANEPDQEQADFFHGFVRELKSWPTWYQAESQLAAVNNKLNKEEKEKLAMLTYVESEETK